MILYPAVNKLPVSVFLVRCPKPVNPASLGNRKFRVEKPICLYELWYPFARVIRIQQMILHQDLYIKGFTGRRQLSSLVQQHAVQFAGNRKLKIYGRLCCTSGKRMKTVNRVFFNNEQEAVDNGYRPCGHCMRYEYRVWKQIK